MTQSAFDLIRTHSIAALNLQFEEYRHRVTGARHLHLAADDTHNAFLVAFLTVPQDSTGVAHILEHTVLCGSQKYPVRDPFFMMTRRSLSTFMNAFTSSDWTAYPFASQNRKDFNNLLDVYLDAVFFPLLNELDFAQEGHRIEFADSRDPDSPLVYKGIVYNEMKGAMSSPVQRLAQTLQSHLFPTTTYHYNSGGDPEKIVDLTYADLNAFHRRHYHPSNAVFMTYGDIPAAAHQQRIQDQALATFQALPLDFAVADEQRYGKPLQVEAAYPLDVHEDPDHKTHVVLGWLLDTVNDPYSVMQAHVLSNVLLDNSSSPLRHALETCGLGTAPSPLCGFDHSTRETTFVAGLEGSDPGQAEAIEALIMQVIAAVAERGVAQEALESALHQLELSQREITGDGFPYGLHLMLEALAPALHGGDPIAALDIDPLLERLRQDSRAPGFVQNLIRRLLLHNEHRVRLVMAPDKSLASRAEDAERQRLQALKAAMSEADKKRVLERAEALAVRQGLQDQPELLPRVGLEDVPAELKIPAARARSVAGLPATWYSQGTNGMVYQQLIVDVPALPAAQLDLLPVYCACLTEVGSADRDYLTTQARQAAVTGGVSARCIVRGSVDDVQQAGSVIVLAGKALARNAAALTDLLRETFTSPRFDELPRLRELIGQLRVQREESVVDHGHSLAVAAASSGLSPAAALSHRWDGLQGLQTLKQLDAALNKDTGLVDLADRLTELHRLIETAPRQLLVVSEAEYQDGIAAAFEAVWQHALATATDSRLALDPLAMRVQQAWSTSTQVNFCAKVYPTVPQNHPDAAALQVLGEFLRNGYLHRAIREQGGAYGAGASYQADSGAFRLFSYRDPRLQETFADFDAALVWLKQTEHTARVLEEAILGIIASIDRPGSPAGEAISAFFGNLFGRTPAQRRQFRQRVLEVTLADLQRVAERYLQPERASSAVLSSSDRVASLHGFEKLSI